MTLPRTMTDVVLAVGDEEERAEYLAEELSSLDWDVAETNITVFHVFSDNDEGASIVQFRPAGLAEASLKSKGYAVELVGRSGDTSEEIVTFASESGADVIAIGGRKRSPAGKAIFGSITQDVMLQANRPVLFCPTDDY